MEIKQKIVEIEKRLEKFERNNKVGIDALKAEITKLKAKHGPVVPWVGARCQRKGSDCRGSFVWSADHIMPETVVILDDPLHPQFMPNDGVNPWPDDMEVQVIFNVGSVGSAVSSHYDWSNANRIIGSRPACGWEEYLKERE